MAREAAAQIRQHLAEEPEEADAGALGFRFSPTAKPWIRCSGGPWHWWCWPAWPASYSGSGFPNRTSNVAHCAAVLYPPRWEQLAGRSSPNRLPGEPQYRLSLDRRQRFWYLDTDRDGDGIFDTRHEFQASAAAW